MSHRDVFGGARYHIKCGILQDNNHNHFNYQLQSLNTYFPSAKPSYKIDHFELSKANSQQPGPAYDSDCRSTVRTPGRVSDYLSVPNSYLVSQPELQATHYCGSGLAGQELIARPPFLLLFASDAQSSASETGFQLSYTVRRAQEVTSPAAGL